MRSLRSSFLLFFLCLGFSGWGQLQFRLPNQILHYRINLSTSELWQESRLGDWGRLGVLKFEKVNTSEIPLNDQVNVFPYQKSYLVTIPGVQQVYLLDMEKMEFMRLDNSFYRGYNFYAIQYLRNDTLFSHGGVGFWHANNVSTYFSFKTKEWDITSAPEENGPRWMNNEFGGYDTKRQVLSIIEFPELYLVNKQLNIYKYFEKSKEENHWKFLGNINIELIRKLGISRLESQFINGNYFFLNGPIFSWADPATNSIYQVKDVIPMFNLNFEFAYNKGYIYSYHKINAPMTDGAMIKIDSISIEKLKTLSTRKGPFYIEPYPTELYGYGAAAILILTAVGFYAYRKRKPQKAQESNAEPLDGLPAGASAFLNACLHYSKGHTFSSQHFTEMMGYGSYAYETQRQVRAKLIKGINSYFWAHYRMDDVIVRQTANDDKRFSVYLIAEVHYDTLKKLLHA